MKLSISQVGDIGLAQQTARAMARTIHFNEVASEEIAIAASELASNLVKHARGGTLTFTPLQRPGGVGLQMESLDNGPSIPNIDQALTDRFSTAASLGLGLGAVNRLMDELEISSLPGRGTRVACCRWLRDKPKSTTTPAPLDFGAATRAYRKGDFNGDSFVFKRWEQGALVGVIDGLGHGELAQQAALTARQYIESHYDQPLPSIFLGTDRACRSGRGVVMALARFDLASHKFLFASIGNIEVRLLGSPAPVNFIVRRGIVGVNAPAPVVTECPWDARYLFVLHSDGVKTRWNLDEFPNLPQEPAAVISHRLLMALDKGEDDATIVVVKGGAQ